MTTTLKLDWSAERIDAVCFALQAFTEMYRTEHANPRITEIDGALADIDTYRNAVAAVKASTATETTGYCAGCGEYIEYDAALRVWAANSRLQPLRCPAYADHRHIRYTAEQEGTP